MQNHDYYGIKSFRQYNLRAECRNHRGQIGEFPSKICSCPRLPHKLIILNILKSDQFDYLTKCLSIKWRIFARFAYTLILIIPKMFFPPKKKKNVGATTVGVVRCKMIFLEILNNHALID